MHVVRYLQHWLSGTGARLHVTDFVPASHPLRQWADTFPWAALVSAIEHSVAQRFPEAPRVAAGPSLSASCWRWNCSSMNWAPPMRRSAIVCGRTLPSCMPVASVSIRSIPRKPTLCYPRRSASFVAALTQP